MLSTNDFRVSLDNEYDFPAEYSFKFIIKSKSKSKIFGLLPQSKITERLSKNGSYVSITLTKKMNSSEEIVYIYEKASKIKGVISL